MGIGAIEGGVKGHGFWKAPLIVNKMTGMRSCTTNGGQFTKEQLIAYASDDDQDSIARYRTTVDRMLEAGVLESVDGKIHCNNFAEGVRDQFVGCRLTQAVHSQNALPRRNSR
jgi:hypothetical protein